MSGINKDELDNFITHDWRDDFDLEPDCEHYDPERDICIYPHDWFYGKGCYGKSCYNYHHKRRKKE